MVIQYTLTLYVQKGIFLFVIQTLTCFCLVTLLSRLFDQIFVFQVYLLKKNVPIAEAPGDSFG